MKKTLAVFLVTLFLLSSCSAGTGPEKSIASLFSAAQKLDTQTIAGLILPTNVEAVEKMKRVMSPEEEDDIFTKSFRDYFTEAAKKISYKIIESKIDGDKAQISVESHYVDSGPLLSKVFSEIFRKAFELSFAGEEFDEAAQATLFQEIVAEQIPETLIADGSKTLTLNLVKHEGQWLFEDIGDDFIDVLSAGFVSAAENLDFFGDLDE